MIRYSAYKGGLLGQLVVGLLVKQDLQRVGDYKLETKHRIW
jgi:hypothetical protein